MTAAETKSNAAFEVTLEGSFYKQSERGKLVTKFKDVKAEIPVGVKPQDIMWYLKNKWFPNNIEKLHPEASSVREIRIVDKKELAGAKEATKSTLPDAPKFSAMNIKELDEFAMVESLPVNVADFSNIDDARRKVSDLYDEKILMKRNEGKADPADSMAKELSDVPGVEVLPDDDEDDVID